MPTPKKTPKGPQARNHAQISMTVDPKILAEINDHAKAAGLSRSAYLIVAAREKMERAKK